MLSDRPQLTQERLLVEEHQIEDQLSNKADLGTRPNFWCRLAFINP
jgi:hypothetical protein